MEEGFVKEMIFKSGVIGDGSEGGELRCHQGTGRMVIIIVISVRFGSVL